MINFDGSLFIPDSFSCKEHGWHHATESCPSCEGWLHTDISPQIEELQYWKSKFQVALRDTNYLISFNNALQSQIKVLEQEKALLEARLLSETSINDPKSNTNSQNSRAKTLNPR